MTSQMQLSHNFSAMSVAFTEENLIGSAGLVPAVGLATQIGLVGLGQEHVKLSGPGRANAGVKLMSIVAGGTAHPRRSRGKGEDARWRGLDH